MHTLTANSSPRKSVAKHIKVVLPHYVQGHCILLDAFYQLFFFFWSETTDTLLAQNLQHHCVIGIYCNAT
jgi:hypothetical protein